MRIIVPDLIPGKSYNLQFRSKNEAGEVSVWGNTHMVTISTQLSKPLAPTNVQLESIGDSFHARWNQVTNSDDGSPATDLAGYVVRFRNVDNGQTAQFETTDTNFELTYNLNFAMFTPTAGTIGVRVAAKNILGSMSEWSDEVIAQNPPPGPVTNLTAVGGIDSIIAQWEPPANLEDDFKEYRVHIGDSASFTITESNLIWRGVGTTALYQTSSVIQHYVKVVAVDKFNSVSQEQVAGPVTPRSAASVDVDAPDTPTNLNGSIDGHRLTVTWTPPPNSDNDLAGYQIGYRPKGQIDWSYANASHEDNRIVIEPITRFVDYEIRIQAHDFSFNYSPASSIVDVAKQTNSAPAAPTGVQVKGAITTATVVWNANTEDDLYGYEVQFESHTPTDSDEVWETTARTISFSENVTEDTLYYARVRAVDLEGLKSPWSSVATGTVGFFDLGDIDLGDIEDRIDNSITGYEVQYSVNSSETNAPTNGWSSQTPTRTPGTFIWYRTVITYGSGSTSTTSPALLTGNTGSPGAPGTTYYTWLKYADTPTSGMSDTPTGKKYMGIAVGKTSSTESSNYSDYTWSLIQGEKGDQGIPGEPGEDGQTTYTWVKYAPNGSPTDAQISDLPTGMSHIGLAFNKTTATKSDTASDYQWSLIQGADGSPGIPGVSVTAVTPFFRTVTKGAAAPGQPSGTADPSGWSKTEPNYTANTDLYRTERIDYSNGTATWTPVTKVATYSGIDAVNTIAITADKRVRKSNVAPVVADGAGAPVGALWYVYGPATAPGTGTVLKETYEWTGSVWQPRGIDRTFLPAVDIGTGTFGDLVGDRITANSIGAIKIKTAEIAADSAFLTNLTVQSGNIASLEANKITGGSGLLANLTVKSTLTLGDATNNGVIQTHGYNSNSGVRIDKTGIIVNSGSISAAALNIQLGQNLIAPEYADFELNSSFYDTGIVRMGNDTSSILQEGRFNKQSLRYRVATATAAWAWTGLILERDWDSYSLAVEAGKTYIVSFYMRGASIATSINARLNFPDNTNSTPQLNTDLPVGGGWVRYSFSTVIPANQTKARLQIYLDDKGLGLKVGQGFDIDGVQVEEKIGAIDTPSAWSPPGSTTIDGAMIRTGEIRSNTTINVNGVDQPMWSLNANGGMQVGSATIRGVLTVGATTDAEGSAIQSSNYLAGSSGFLLQGSDGFAEFQNIKINLAANAGSEITVGTLAAGRTVISGGSSGGIRYFSENADEPISEFGKVISTFRVDPDDGQMKLAASMDAEGAVSGIIGSFSALEIAGEDVTEKIFDTKGEVIRYDDTGVDKRGPYASETGYREIGFQAKAGHAYRIECWMAMENHGNTGSMFSYLKYTDDGTAPKITGTNTTVIGAAEIATFANEGKMTLTFFYEALFDKRVRVLLTGRGGGGRTFSFVSSRIAVTDMGLYSPLVNSGRFTLGGASGAPPADETPPPELYKKWYDFDWEEVYQPGLKANHSVGGLGTKLRMGRVGSTANNPYATIIGIQSAVSTDTSSATIKKVGLRLTNVGWQSGSVYVGYGSYSSAPATMPTTTPTGLTNLGSIAAGATKTFWLPSSFYTTIKTNNRALVIGQLNATGGTYRMLDFTNKSGPVATRARLYVEYEK